MSSSESIHGMWSSRLMFILAAAGSAVGLGNIWRFPYVAGENGGGAFVLVYLLCIFLIGIPILSSEIVLGRAGRQSPINTMRDLASKSGANPFWQGIGWMGAIAGFLVVSFYGVIAGWAMSYVVETGKGTFVGADAAAVGGHFGSFTGDVWQVIFWHAVFMALTTFIVARGVSDGLEKTVKYLMPALLVLMLLLVGYSMSNGNFMEAVDFLFALNFDKLTWDGVLIAMGQAFFTLSLGMGAIMTYGAYMPKGTSIIGAATTIALLDTAIALLSGLVIFPLVFANGLESSAGPGLMFVTLPLAFGQMDAGLIVGVTFFVLVSFAAITSSISMIEPTIAWLVERTKLSRMMAGIVVGLIAWAFGLGSAFSFNIWSDVQFWPGKNYFESVDHIANNIMLPLGGMFIAIFSGWFVDRAITRDELSDLSEGQFRIWEVLVRFVAPASVGIVFVLSFL